MLKKSLLGAVGATLLFTASQAMASGFIVGVKGGGFLPKFEDNEGGSFAPAFMASAQLGYEFLDLVAADVAVELEYARTLSKTSPKDAKNADFSFQTIGAYLSVRSAGPIYAIGRVGAVNSKITADIEGHTASEDVTKAAVGAGLGFSLGARTELELTRYNLPGSNNQAYYLSLGASF